MFIDDEDEVVITISPVNCVTASTASPLPPIDALCTAGFDDDFEIDLTKVESVFVENDAPDINNVVPEDDDVVDDTDVDITADIEDDDSGIPEPEDGAGFDGDDEYISTAILVSTVQCTDAELIDGAVDANAAFTGTGLAGTELTTFLTTLDCGSATNNITIVNLDDEDDFDEIDDGFELDTSVFFPKDATGFFTIIAFDNAGNFEIFVVIQVYRYRFGWNGINCFPDHS